ncbi:MAG: cyclic beta 1-2 glucan synthetase, partial [Pseudomonadota bacterium]|nr:cyclic beta 1-2 glucan synthetase [Pseudomonadota bacterium]
MPDVKLLSNDRYHVMVTAEGSGYSRWNGLAVTRWREDAALESGGTFFYLRDAGNGEVWSATARPVEPGQGACTMQLTTGQATFSRRDHELEVVTTIAVAADDDVELRRLRVTNLSSRRRRLSITSFAEIVLAPPATDAAHPAFSKIFIETEIEPELGVIVATRRPSAPDETRAWCFHQAVVHGGHDGLSYETDRLRFIGRGRDTSMPAAMLQDDALSGQEGPVLDAIAAIRVPLALEAGASCTIDWWTGIAGTCDGCTALAGTYRAPGAGDRVLGRAAVFADAMLRRIGSNAADASTFERLAGALLCADAALRGDADDIAQNRRGQSGLWGFGISGDVPVVLLRVAAPDQLDLVRRLVQAQAFWSAHGIRCELMIVSGPAPADEPPLLEQVQQAIAASGGAASLGKPGGIFVRDDATLDDGDRTLLKSVARIVVAGSWDDLLRRLDPSPPVLLAPTVAVASARPREETGQDAPPPFDSAGLLDFNGHGGFTADRREYVVTASASHMTPAPWTNVITNAEFGTLISESGSASTWSENAHELRLTPWSNDPVGDANT